MNAQIQPVLAKPRLGFLGVGWIGRQRMQRLAESGAAIVAAVADAAPDAVAAAKVFAPRARAASSLEALLDEDLDGIVIATPSGAHAEQAIAALEQGVAVFCQKPLARTAAEAEQVIAAARRNDCSIDVDFSYRCVAGVPALRERIRNGELGEIYAIDLCFHNAYGPDKPWFYDVCQSGGGCVMDLGIHLVDLACWMTGCADAYAFDARLYSRGQPLEPPIDTVEDYASVQWRLAQASVRMTCSWRMPAGCEAVIEASFYGTRGGASLRNVGGSFYDFIVDEFDGTRRERIAGPSNAWGGRSLIEWAERLAAGERFAPESQHLVDVARMTDRIYGR